MKKIKKGFKLTIGALLALLFKYTDVSASPMAVYGPAVPEYGVALPKEESTVFEKVASFILTPAAIAIFTTLAIGAGIAFYLKRKKKNASKNN